jgi:hypothetical protein
MKAKEGEQLGCLQRRYQQSARCLRTKELEVCPKEETRERANIQREDKGGQQGIDLSRLI